MRGSLSPPACTRREKRRARRKEEEEATKQMLAAMAAAYEANNELQRSYDISSNSASQRKRKSSQRSVRLNPSHNITRNKIDRVSAGSQTLTSNKLGHHHKSPPMPPTITNLRKQIAKHEPPAESFITDSEDWCHTGLLSSLPDSAPAHPNVPAKLQRKKFFTRQNVLSGSEIPYDCEPALCNTSIGSSGFDTQLEAPGALAQTNDIFHQTPLAINANLPFSYHAPTFRDPQGSQTHYAANMHTSSYPAQISFPDSHRHVPSTVMSQVEYHRWSHTSLGQSTRAPNNLANSTPGGVEHVPSHRVPLIQCDMDISSRLTRHSAPNPNPTMGPLSTVVPSPLSMTYHKNEEFRRISAVDGQTLDAYSHRRTNPLTLPQAR